MNFYSFFIQFFTLYSRIFLFHQQFRFQCYSRVLRQSVSRAKCKIIETTVIFVCSYNSFAPCPHVFFLTFSYLPTLRPCLHVVQRKVLVLHWYNYKQLHGHFHMQLQLFCTKSLCVFHLLRIFQRYTHGCTLYRELYQSYTGIIINSYTVFESNHQSNA